MIFLKSGQKQNDGNNERNWFLSGDCGCKYILKESSQPREINFANSSSPWSHTHSELLSFFRMTSAILSVPTIMDDNFDCSVQRNSRMKSDISKGRIGNENIRQSKRVSDAHCTRSMRRAAQSILGRRIQPSIVDQGKGGERSHRNSWKTTTQSNSLVHIVFMIMIVNIFISVAGQCVGRRWRKSQMDVIQQQFEPHRRGSMPWQKQ